MWNFDDDDDDDVTESLLSLKQRRLKKEPQVHNPHIKHHDRVDRHMKSSMKRSVLKLLDENQKEILQANFVLADLKQTKIIFNASKNIKLSKRIYVEFIKPLPIILTAKVIASGLLPSSSGVKKQRSVAKEYRVVLEFIFASKLQKNAFIDFYRKSRDDSYVPARWHKYQTDMIAKKRMADKKKKAA